MEKKRSLKRKLCIAGIGVAALLFFLFLYDSISYEKIVNHRLLDTEGVTFTYNGWTYDMGEKTVDIRYAARLSVPNRLHYWGAFRTRPHIFKSKFQRLRFSPLLHLIKTPFSCVWNQCAA